MAVPGGWFATIVLASLVTSGLTGNPSLTVGVATTAVVLAAWRMVKILAATRDALDSAERDRVALQQALRRSQRLEALGRLAVGVAHDLNNHLTVISNNVEMLARRLDGTQDHLLRHTEAAMQGVQRAATLTGRLLTFSHHPAPEPEPVDVDRLVRGLADLLRRTLGDRIGLDVLPSSVPWLTWADVNQLENALLSLAVNANDQLRDGASLTIAVTNVQQHRPCGAIPSGDCVQVDIGDLAGSPKRRVWRLADDVSHPNFAMARAFVHEAGGCLLQSDPASGGLALRLLLPRYAPPSMATAASRRATAGPPTILVVEDDAEVRGSCVEVLEQLGYRVLQAPDAMEAFRLFADHGGIDLLFTDLGLPGGVSGRALADAARNVDAGIRVLFTSGSDSADPSGSADAALLRKPFNPDQLARVVREALAGSSPITQPSFSQQASAHG